MMRSGVIEDNQRATSAQDQQQSRQRAHNQ